MKEPLRAEIDLMREGQVVFTYFHFAADRELTDALLATGSRASPTKRWPTTTAVCRC